MASIELIVDDTYCQQMGKYFVDMGTKIDSTIKSYAAVLETVSSKALVKGETAKALKNYISYVKKMQAQVGNISSTAQLEISNFLKKVDAADKYLF